ncbi:Ras-related protein Rab-32B [Diplonema papillatum]|nr:Ras-related protein Rab-32B [Diplonema papillatum]
MSDPNQEHLYKTLVVGDYAVGKTSLIQRYTTGQFNGHYRITIGVDFCAKQVECDGRTVTLQLWDIAGHERFGAMTRVYYKFATAAVVVFDLTRPSTLESAKKWRSDINAKVLLPNDQPIPMLLVANKCDVKDKDGEIEALKASLNDFCEQNGFFGWMETSAAENINIEQCFKALVHEVVQSTRGMAIAPPRQQDAFLISGRAQSQPAEESRCGGCKK